MQVPDFEQETVEQFVEYVSVGKLNYEFIEEKGIGLQVLAIANKYLVKDMKVCQSQKVGFRLNRVI